MAAHRYWRVICRINSGNASFTGLSEIEMKTSSGGSDQCTGGTAGSSGSIQAGSAANCFDNNTGTGIQWNGTGGNQYVSYDFGSGVTKDIVEITILPKHDGANRTFAEFDVQSSDDGSSWSHEWACSFTGWVIGTVVTFTKPSAVAHRYWRIRLDENQLGSGSTLGLAEVEMKDTVGGSDQCTGGTGSARTVFGGTSAANAFDNNNTTIYSSSGGTNNCEWIRYDFGSGVTKDIVEVTIRGRDDSLHWMQMPKHGWIESGDDKSYIIRWRFTWLCADRNYTARIFKPGNVPTASPGLHRFWGIKVNGTSNAAKVFGCSTLELRAAFGGASICTGGGGVSQFPYTGGGAPASAAFDASTSTNYSGNVANGGGDVLAYDFGVGNEKPQPVQLAIRSRQNGGSNNHEQAPISFQLVYSDKAEGADWVVVQDLTSPATWTDSEVRVFNSPPRRRMLLAA